MEVLATEATAVAAEIRLTNGRVVIIRPDLDRETLSSLLEAVEHEAC